MTTVLGWLYLLGGAAIVIAGIVLMVYGAVIVLER